MDIEVMATQNNDLPSQPPSANTQQALLDNQVDPPSQPPSANTQQALLDNQVHPPSQLPSTNTQQALLDNQVHPPSQPPSANTQQALLDNQVHPPSQPPSANTQQALLDNQVHPPSQPPSTNTQQALLDNQIHPPSTNTQQALPDNQVHPPSQPPSANTQQALLDNQVYPPSQPPSANTQQALLDNQVHPPSQPPSANTQQALLDNQVHPPSQPPSANTQQALLDNQVHPPSQPPLANTQQALLDNQVHPPSQPPSANTQQALLDNQVHPPSQPPSANTQQALLELINTCRAQGQRKSKFENTCHRLLVLNFSSENGRLVLINQLTQLHGNYVEKIIVEGLTHLNKVYTVAKTFEKESTALVELCCSQYLKLMIPENGQEIASPSAVIDWIVQLCEELKKPTLGCSDLTQSEVMLSNCVLRFINIHETIIRAKLNFSSVIPKSKLNSISIFNKIFDVLKTRIHFEAFYELLDQTTAIVTTDAKHDNLLDRLTRRSSVSGCFSLLAHWTNMLQKFSFLTNWFAVQIAEYDFFLHDEELIQRLLSSGKHIDCGNCLLFQISNALASCKDVKFVIRDKETFELCCNYSEVLLRHTLPCFKLLQSESISTNVLQQVFTMLGIKSNRDLRDLIFRNASIPENEVELGLLCQDVTSACDQHVFTITTEALMSLSDQESVLAVLRFWERHYPSDSSHDVLRKILVLVHNVTQMNIGTIEHNMKRLVAFLSQLSIPVLTDTDWFLIVAMLVAVIPDSWDGQEMFDLIKFSQQQTQIPISQGIMEFKNKLVGFQAWLMLSGSHPESTSKMIVLKEGLNIFDDKTHSLEYKFARNEILSIVGSEMEEYATRKYASDFLEAFRASNCINYAIFCGVLVQIQRSCSIDRKVDIFEVYLKFIQETDNDGSQILDTIILFREFLSLPVSTINARRLFVDAVEGRKIDYECIIQCCFLRNFVGQKDDLNDVIALMHAINDKTLCQRNDWKKEFLTEAIQRNHITLAPVSNDIYQLILASMAGCISIEAFDSQTNSAVLSLVCTAVQRHQLVQLSDVLMIYVELTQVFRCWNKLFYGDPFIIHHLHTILSLPLPLRQTIDLVHSITKVFCDQDYTRVQGIKSIIFHLFEFPADLITSSLIDSNTFAAHLKKLVKPSIVRKLANMPVTASGSLQELLLGRMATAFGNGTSVDLFRFVVKKLEQYASSPHSVDLILSAVRAVIEKNVSLSEFERAFEEFTEKLRFSHKVLTPLIAQCITECHAVGLNDEERTRKLILQVSDFLGPHSKWNNVDIQCNLVNSWVPKLLVLTYKEAPDIDQAGMNAQRLFDVANKLVEALLIRSDVQHDIHKLLECPSLGPGDVYSCLQLYRDQSRMDTWTFQNIFDQCVNDVKDWSNTYDTSQALTPGKLAYLVLQQLQRLKVDDINATTDHICSTLLNNYRGSEYCELCKCSTTFKEYFKVFMSVMSKSPHLKEIQHWLTLNAHLVVKCKSVIVEACTWRASTKTCAEALRMDENITEALLNLKKKETPECCAPKTTELDGMAMALKTFTNDEVVLKLFELLRVSPTVLPTDTTLAEICCRVMSSWSEEESLLLLEKIKVMYIESNTEAQRLDKELSILLLVSPFAAKAFQNSAEKAIGFLKTMAENIEHEVTIGLSRVPNWHKQMTDAGFPRQVIESWCTSLVLMEKITSSDVDAIANMTPDTIKLLTSDKATHDIAKCLFTKAAPKTWKTNDESIETHKKNIKTFKHCLQFAKLLNEFASIGSQFKDNLTILEGIKDGTEELCSDFLDDNIQSGNMYKRREQKLFELSAVVIGVNEEIVTQIFRRLARSTKSRPKLFGLVKNTLDKVFNGHLEGTADEQDVTRAIHDDILDLEPNQDAMYRLQTAGYNQSTATQENLWYSLSIQMSAYVSKLESEVKQVKENTEPKMSKLVIVWENQLLQTVKTCSEKIPGCYAPNGFHSEKLVICGLRVDNRILVLYREDKGGSHRREELENVEVKLYPAGMYVFHLYRGSGCSHDTNQLWAAFFKMLLDRRLVPKIFLTNNSPAFGWLQQFVETEPATPEGLELYSCCNLIPSSEDSLDHDPTVNMLPHETYKLMILTPSKTKDLEFSDLKPPNRGQLIGKRVQMVLQRLQREDSLLCNMHPESGQCKMILKRLTYAIRNAVEFAVDGKELTEEAISNWIDMAKLSKGCRKVVQKQNKYCEVILDAVQVVIESLPEIKKYDGCEHVLFT